MAPKKKLNILQDEENPIETEVLAKAIVEVSDAAQRLLTGPLEKRAILILIRDLTGGSVSLRDIELVLESTAEIKRAFVKKDHR